MTYEESENLVTCDLCYLKQSNKGGSASGQFKYRKEFDQTSDKIKPEFSHLKSHLKVHFSKQAHIGNWETWKRIEEENCELVTRSKEVGMRIARICYDIYKNGKSLRSFEMGK